MPTFPINIPLQGAWEYDEDEFCLLDQNGATGSYVDLIENPERFTGYSGPEANNVWAAIYGENCFGRKLGINPLTNSAKSDWDQCTERKTFYRLLSGMIRPSHNY